MKNYIHLFFVLQLVGMISANVVSAHSSSETDSEKIHMRITKGLPLCQEFLDILRLPENRGRLMTPEEVQAFREKLKDIKFDRVQEARKSWEPVYIPDTEYFKNPVWQNVSDREAYDKLSGFIKEWGNAGRFSLAYKKDYVFQKVKMDINRDGKADTLYRQKGGDYILLVEDDGSQFAERFNDLANRRWQVFYYKGKPYFVDATLASLDVLEPKSRKITHDNKPTFYQFFWSDICEYMTYSIK